MSCCRPTRSNRIEPTDIQVYTLPPPTAEKPFRAWEPNHPPQRILSIETRPSDNEDDTTPMELVSPALTSLEETVETISEEERIKTILDGISKAIIVPCVHSIAQEIISNITKHTPIITEFFKSYPDFSLQTLIHMEPDLLMFSSKTTLFCLKISDLVSAFTKVIPPYEEIEVSAPLVPIYNHIRDEINATFQTVFNKNWPILTKIFEKQLPQLVMKILFLANKLLENEIVETPVFAKIRRDIPLDLPYEKALTYPHSTPLKALDLNDLEILFSPSFYPVLDGDEKTIKCNLLVHNSENKSHLRLNYILCSKIYQHLHALCIKYSDETNRYLQENDAKTLSEKIAFSKLKRINLGPTSILENNTHGYPHDKLERFFITSPYDAKSLLTEFARQTSSPMTKAPLYNEILAKTYNMLTFYFQPLFNFFIEEIGSTETIVNALSQKFFQETFTIQLEHITRLTSLIKL